MMDKKPDFIYVEDPEEITSHYDEQRFFSALHQIKAVKFPFRMRLAAFFVALAAGVIGTVSLILTILWWWGASLTLGRVKSAVRRMHYFWGFTKKCAVVTLGSAIAIFSAPLGLGLVFFYFLIQGDNISESILSRFGHFGAPNN